MTTQCPACDGLGWRATAPVWIQTGDTLELHWPRADGARITLAAQVTGEPYHQTMFTVVTWRADGSLDATTLVPGFCGAPWRSYIRHRTPPPWAIDVLGCRERDGPPAPAHQIQVSIRTACDTCQGGQP